MENLDPCYDCYFIPGSPHVERLKSAPDDFFELPIDVQNRIMENTVGHKVGQYFEVGESDEPSHFRVISHSLMKNDIQMHALHMGLSKAWNMSFGNDGRRFLLILKFFGVQDFYRALSWGDGNFESRMKKVVKIFPFGCMRQFYPNEFPARNSKFPNSCVSDWLIGNMIKILELTWNIEVCPSIELFTMVFERCPLEELSMFETIGLMMAWLESLERTDAVKKWILEFGHDRFHSSEYGRQSGERPSIILGRLSSRCLFIRAPTEIDFPYLFMIDKINMDKEMIFAVNLFRRYISRPRWTKETHRFMDEDFKKIGFTVLCMQRFRRDQFLIHKDLIETVMKWIFSAHIQHLYDSK